MKFSSSLSGFLFGTAVIALVQPYQPVFAESSAQVANTARQITVLIDGQNPGSGVIIRRTGNTYTILTARHVVSTRDEYDIVTPDGQKYQLNYNTVKPLPGVDLAIAEFTSTTNYTVAKLGNSRTAPSGTPVYVAGFPAPTATITQSVFNFTDGRITANADRPLADGYALVYSNNTLPGMSGGPVLNAAGEVIGIHGKGDTDSTSAQATANPNVALKTGFNLAIPINTFLSLASGSGILGFVAPAPAPMASLPTADDLYLQANQKFLKQDFRGAIANYNEAIRLNPNYADAYSGRGVARANLQDNQGAIADYDQAIRLNPSFAQAYANRGVARANSQDSRGAIADFDQAIRLNPSYDFAYTNRAAARLQLRDFQGAIADSGQAIRLNPNYAMAYNNRGHARLQLGDFQGAIADLDQVIRFDPSRAVAYFNRGNARLELRDYQGAISDFDQASRLEPNRSIIYYYRGVTRGYLQDFQGAIADYDHAIRLEPNNAAAYNNRGVARANMQNYQGARVDFQQAAQLALAQGNQQIYQSAIESLRRMQQ